MSFDDNYETKNYRILLLLCVLSTVVTGCGLAWLLG